MNTSKITRIAKSAFAIVAISAAFVLTGCGSSDSNTAPKVSTNDTTKSENILNVLNNADEIQLKKSAISFGDQWSVSIDGEKIAEIKGQPIYLIGDTYSMFDLEGNLVGSESQDFKVVNHSAKLYDYDNVQRGSIDQKILTLLAKYTLNDSEGEKIGSLEQKFALGMKGNLLNSSGETVYSVDRKIVSVGASITITRVSESDIEAIDAIWLTVIMNEIYESEE